MATNCAFEFQVKHFGFTDANSEDFYTSQWSKSKPIFLAYRTFMMLYTVIWSIFTTIHLTQKFPDYYAYLSDWGEWTLVVHFTLAFIVALHGFIEDKWMKGSRRSPEDGCCSWNRCHDGTLRWYHHICWVVTSATTGISYIITIIYWAFLSGIPTSSVATNIHQHVMNSVLITIDNCCASRVPVRFLHFIYVSLYGIVYTFFTLILHWTDVKHVFYKGILDWQNDPGVSAGVCVALIIIGAPIMHLINFGLYHLKMLIARRCGCAGTDHDTISNGENNTGFETTAE